MKRIITAGLGLLAIAGQPAVAADMPAKAPIYKDQGSWSGVYLGGNAGYSFGRSRSEVRFVNAVGAAIAAPAGSVTNNSFSLDGAVAGGQIGANWQTGTVVFGVEADAQWSGQKGSGGELLCIATGATGGVCLPGSAVALAGFPGTTLALEHGLTWFSTMRGRLGLTAAPTVLVYFTAGLAVGGIESSGVLRSRTPAGAAVTTAFSTSTTKAGWAVGGGVEAILGSNWTGRIEYLYLDFGYVDDTISLTPAVGIGANWASRISDSIIRVGLNYKFDGPVSAKY